MNFPTPILQWNPDGSITMIVIGDLDDYKCPNCGTQLCWLDFISEWSCEKCKQSVS